MTNKQKTMLEKIAREHGTPVFIIDHKKIRENYYEFREKLPDVQAYFAVKANSNPEIIKTMYDLVQVLMWLLSLSLCLFMRISSIYPKKKGKILSGIKLFMLIPSSLPKFWAKLNAYKILVTFDNIEELRKIKKYAPDVGLVLRIRVPNTGSMVELSSKFGAHPGEAVDLIAQAINFGLGVEGLVFTLAASAIILITIHRL